MSAFEIDPTRPIRCHWFRTLSGLLALFDINQDDPVAAGRIYKSIASLLPYIAGALERDIRVAENARMRIAGLPDAEDVVREFQDVYCDLLHAHHAVLLVAGGLDALMLNKGLISRPSRA